MKIEIAESLSQSYLKHVEGCRITQTNWKTSAIWKVTQYDQERAKTLFERFKETSRFSNIFRKNSFDQLLKQAEIDVLGINPTEGVVYGIDVAFHSVGLNYGDKLKTSETIIKKIMRTIFIMQVYFSEYDKFHSYFITPKTSPSLKLEIESMIAEANQLINDESISIKFITDDRFYAEIVSPLMENAKDENDTSELFLRAVKLLALEKANQQKKLAKNTLHRTVNGMKIGQFVKLAFRDLHQQNLISNEELSNLQSRDYARKVFKMNLEILRDRTQSITDKTGNKRYYSSPDFMGGYYLNSQWFEKHWDGLLNWLDAIGYKY